MAGHRFAMCLVEINDDETAKEPQQLKGGELSKLAGKWCERMEFRDWLALAHKDEYKKVRELWHMTRTSVSSLDVAAEVVRQICGVKSRAALDHNPAAARIFDEQIRKPYMLAIGVVE